MMQFMEIREVSVVVPVTQSGFCDDEEVIELFTYVFDKSELVKILHPPMRFKSEFINSEKVFTFTLAIRANDKDYEFHKSNLELLVESYSIYEREYIRFKKFGNIESHMLMRK
jgi:hypothetical protein